jgi:hypothetical protein
MFRVHLMNESTIGERRQTMLFVALLKGSPGTNEEGRTRRMEWDYPEGGAQVVAEYWLQANDPGVIVVVEADHVGQIMATFAGWNDVFEIAIHPAVTAEDGLEMLKQMSQA